MTQKTDRQFCERCGERLIPRADPRGRKARFCSDACRAAASRERRAAAHKAELEQARNQMAIDFTPPPSWDDRCRDAVKVLRAVADQQADRGVLTEQSQTVFDAAQQLVSARRREPRLSFNEVPPMRTSNARKKKKKRRR